MNTSTTTKELHEGINGSGNKVWTVAIVNETGRWIFMHRFTNKEEALNWIKWA